MSVHARIAVLASGGGSNLQALIDRLNTGGSAAARVELVVGSRAGIGALERAERAEIPALALDARAMGADAFRDALAAALETHRIDLVVLAGWLQLVPAEVVARYHGRMVNVHPALLPAFGGKGMYGDARAPGRDRVRRAGQRRHGAPGGRALRRGRHRGAVARPRAPRRHAGDRWPRACWRWSTASCPSPWRRWHGAPSIPVVDDAPLAFDLVAAAAPADASIRRTMHVTGPGLGA